jgi:hypothetical protein
MTTGRTNIIPSGAWFPTMTAFPRTRSAMDLPAPIHPTASTLACLRELTGNYDFEGIFVDMVFWPDVCYCAHCTERFRKRGWRRAAAHRRLGRSHVAKVRGRPPALDAGIRRAHDKLHQGA